eukprot:CAMPEP_0170643676 /NCGR_PEP_ID=MMETSP0224-20130122/42030_1 /TAXON_ID=285029 /ORGANISM="Togula jolla, Strain CCCM 725" /LENGTH=434 /DNA_ID=CAMNT_0010974555 /DNA_START=62 /DNA_END=1366 /DNA_ORIENTATION=-
MPFDIPDALWMRAFQRFTLAFWIVDLVLGFFMGFYIDGIVELRLSRTARNHFYRWFFVDLFIVLAEILVSESASAFRVLKTARFLRVYRSCRQLFQTRSIGRLGHLGDLIKSDFLLLFLRLLRSVCILLVLNHFISCAWWAVGTVDFGQERRWVDRLQQEDRSVLYCYLTSLHWSLAQFTPASSEISPTNEIERCFGIGCLLLGLMVFSSIVSSTTAVVSAMRALKTQEVRRNTEMREFFIDRSLSTELKARIRSFLNTKAAHFTSKPMSAVENFAALPFELKRILHWELFSALLMKHPLFLLFGQKTKKALHEICQYATSEALYLPGEEIFRRGSKAEEMILPSHGRLNYLPGIEHEGQGLKTISVEMGQWLCEQCLWIAWTHQGRLETTQGSLCALVNAKQFSSVIEHRPQELHCCRQYAQLWLEYVRDVLL